MDWNSVMPVLNNVLVCTAVWFSLVRLQLKISATNSMAASAAQVEGKRERFQTLCCF